MLTYSLRDKDGVLRARLGGALVADILRVVPGQFNQVYLTTDSQKPTTVFTVEDSEPHSMFFKEAQLKVVIWPGDQFIPETLTEAT